MSTLSNIKHLQSKLIDTNCMPMICATKRGGACLLAKGHLCEERKNREYLCCSSIRCKEAVIHVCKMYLIVSIRFILFVMHDIFCACVFQLFMFAYTCTWSQVHVSARQYLRHFGTVTPGH